MALFFLALMSSVFPAMGVSRSSVGECSPKSPPLILGGKGGFVFYLVTDEKGIPVCSGDGSPVYEGIRRLKDDKRHINISYNTLHRNDHLEPSNQKATAWLPQSMQAFIPSSNVLGLLDFFQKHPKQLLSFLSGMPSAKAQLMLKLLFDQKIVFTKNDLKALQRSAFNPDPAPVTISIPIKAELSDGVLGVIFTRLIDMTSNVTLDEISFDIEKKEVRFDPAKNVIHVRLNANGAEIKGPTHDLGYFLGLQKYTDSKTILGIWDIKSYDVVRYLSSGKIGKLSAELSFGFVRDQQDENIWNFRLETPLKLILPPNAAVQATFVVPNPDGTTSDAKEDIRVSSEAAALIEKTFGDAMADAFNSSFFADDLAPHFVMLASKNPSLMPGDVSFTSRLSEIRFYDQGLLVGFDSLLKYKRPADCVARNFSEKDLLIRSFQGGRISPPLKIKAWSMLSTFPETPAWSNTEAMKGPMNVEIRAEAIDLFNKAAWAGGLYCLDTRAWKNRPGHIPLMEVHATQAPALRLSQSALQADFSIDFLTYPNTFSGRSLSERLSNPRSQRFSFVIPVQAVLEGESKAIAWQAPQNLTIQDFNDAENDFMRKLSALFFNRLFSGDSAEHFKRSYSEINETFFQNKAALTALSWDDRQLNASIDWKQFAALEPGAPEAVEADVSAPRTVIAEDILKEKWVSSSFVSVRWNQNTPNDGLFFSWRLISAAKPAGTPWSAFQREREILLPLDQAGNYEVQVRAMNTNYEIEETPQRYWFHYDGDGSASPAPTDESSWNKPPSTEQKAAAVVGTPRYEASKGLFGCSIQAKEDVPLSWTSSLWLLLGALLTWRLRKKFLGI